PAQRSTACVHAESYAGGRTDVSRIPICVLRLHYDGEASAGGGIATAVDGCDRQFRRRARCNIETVTGHRFQTAARRLDGVAGACLIDGKITERCSTIYCVYGSGSAKRATTRIVKDSYANRGAAVRYQPVARVKDLYCYRWGN